jgi:hypothetical protein
MALWAIRTWHLPRPMQVALGLVQAGPSGKCGQFERGITHAQSWSYLARFRLGVGKTWAIRTWHLPRPIQVALGLVQAGPLGKCGQFERGITHAQSWSYLARFRLGSCENLGNSNVASPTPNPGLTWPGAGWSVRKNVVNSDVGSPTSSPGRTWPGAGWPSGKCEQFERGISHAQSWSCLASCLLLPSFVARAALPNHYLCGKRVKNEQLARAISRVCAKSTIDA